MRDWVILILLCLVVLGTIAVGTAAEEYGPVEVGSVEAIVLEGPLAIKEEGVELDEAKHRDRFPEHPELYVPMPIPDPTKRTVTITEPESRLISYNMLTGEETVSDITPKSLPTAKWVHGGLPARAEIGNEDLVLPRNFSALSWVPNQEDHPWCVNVKLYMRFGLDWYVGSGTLIDSMHVLTAGHCVHDVLSGGTWADEIVVVPAYENGTAPYGTATAVQLHSWVGWTKDANWDHDMGVIDLDRPIGALTGWHGYGYDSNWSFFSGNTFHNPGYPAASPYNGEYMYYWYGNFDECPASGTSSQVKFNKQSYGGQSGSGAYHIDSGNRYVYAELSNGTSTWTRDVCITSTKFGYIGDFIATDTPATFDLIPLDVNTAPPTAITGAQLSAMDYVVHNYSSSSWSGTVTVKVYLSTNDNITIYDTLIQTHYLTYGFSPKSSTRVTVTTPPTIPAGTTAGNYWIGVILDISDNDTLNNDSDGQDASSLTLESPTAAVFRVDDAGNVLADSSFYGSGFHSGSADVAEWVPVSEPVEPGDVLELDPNHPGHYRKSRGPCSNLVAGVVSTEPGFVLGSPPATDDSGLSTPDSGPWTDDSRPSTVDSALLALIGIVPVKVTDEGGPIEPGDLLTTSSTSGYAMRWDPESGEPCNFIGKALEPLDSGTGVIQVLLMR
jgi:V8-like Glu-specific endopeptidase